MSTTWFGAPHGPLHGKEAARGFYEHLVRDITTEQMIPVRSHYGEDFCVIEHEWIGTVPGTFLGVPGNGRRISFRLLHVWEFKDGLMSRENVWLDGGSIVQQLTARSRSKHPPETAVSPAARTRRGRRPFRSSGAAPATGSRRVPRRAPARAGARRGRAPRR